MDINKKNNISLNTASNLKIHDVQVNSPSFSNAIGRAYNDESLVCTI